MKRRKIYYVPGMISLIFLPILCMWYLSEHKNVLRSVEVYYAAKYDSNNTSQIIFDTTILSKPRNIRRYYNFYFCGNKTIDSIQFEKIKRLACRIVNNNDTINGLHISFGDNIKYGLYIKTVDFLRRYTNLYFTTQVNEAFRKHKDLYSGNFILFEDQLWFFNYKYPKLEKEVWECDIKCINVDYKPTFKEEIEEWIENQKILFKLWPFFLVFIAFSIISILYIKNKTTN